MGAAQGFARLQERNFPLRLILAAFFLSLASLLSACIGPIGCTDLFAPAVVVTVKDAQGNTLADARVAYSLDGAAMKDADCFNPVDSGGCEQWNTPDQPGDYLVRASSADGSRSAEQRIQVDGDGCHAFPQSMTLTLQ
jgi:hypothetical protein